VGTIAFFDFDGTLIRHDSGVLVALPSARRGLLGPALFAELVATWLLSKVGLRTRTDAMRVGFRCYAGFTLAELNAIMDDLYASHLQADLSPTSVARVRAHRDAGDRLVILTAAAVFLAEPIARDLAFDELVGTRVGFVEGRCTGLVEGEIVEGAVKLAAARTIAARAGVELARCAFYSDHIADLPLLEVVGTPVAVGPNRALQRVARERGYRVLEHDAAPEVGVAG
jgi:HAD superfamily hydrolase (TIGR01490 family)